MRDTARSRYRVRAARETRCADTERNRDALLPRAACVCVIQGAPRVVFAATDDASTRRPRGSKQNSAGVCACGTLPDVRAELATDCCRRRRCVCRDVVQIDVQRTISRPVVASSVLYFTWRWEATLARMRAHPYPASGVYRGLCRIPFAVISSLYQSKLATRVYYKCIDFPTLCALDGACYIYSSTLRLLLCVPGCSCKKKKKGGGRQRTRK